MRILLEKVEQARHSLNSWYIQLRDWIDAGKCKAMPKGIDPFRKTLNKLQLLACGQEWL